MRLRRSFSDSITMAKGPCPRGLWWTALPLPSSSLAEPPPSAGGLRQTGAKGVFLIFVLKAIGTLAGRLTQVVLPLFLLPSDFGIFALAVLFSGILGLVGEFGMSTELIRRKDRFEEAANTAFLIRLTMTMVLIAAATVVGWVASQ